MHLVETYALQAGGKIGQMNVYPKFYPLPFDNYICIQPFSKNSKSYSYWEEVLQLIFPFLSKMGISIVQVGGKDERALPLCHHTQGKTSFGQLEYILSKAALVLTADSISSHLAGYFDIPRVVLISNNYKNCVAPYFGSKWKEILLEPPERAAGTKPSFALDEANKAIDTIKPEVIAASVASLLQENFFYPFETTRFGGLYNARMVESIPNQVVDIKSLNIPSIIMRMDVEFNETNLAAQLSHCPVSIVTNKPINRDLLKTYAKNITELFYLVELDNEPSFIKDVINLGIKCHLMTNLSESVIRPIRIHYMDYGIISIRNVQKPKELEGINNLYYKSGKFTLSNGKVYPSHAAYKDNLSISNFSHTPLPVIDREDFWSEHDHFYFLTYK